MRTRAWLVVLMALAACSSPASKPHPSSTPGKPSAAASERLPDLTLPSLAGGPPVRLAQGTGKPRVINAWASWCGPCRKELPHLARAAHDYRGRVDFLGVDVSDNPADARAMVQKTGADFPHVVDADAVTRVSLGYTGGLPTTVFVDPQGRIVGRERTWFRSYADVQAAMRRHLGVSP